MNLLAPSSKLQAIYASGRLRVSREDGVRRSERPSRQKCLSGPHASLHLAQTVSSSFRVALLRRGPLEAGAASP